jgi:hypothetical protein
MLTEEQKENVVANVHRFKEKTVEYINMKIALQEYKEKIERKTEELEKVAAEERQMEAAMDVLYGQSKKESKVREIEQNIKSWRQQSDTLRNELTQVKTDLIGQMRELPIPADLENSKLETSSVTFPYFEGTQFGKVALDTMSDLFRREPPLTFGDVTLLPEKVVVNNASKKQEAIHKLVEAIRHFRMLVDSISKSYEQIDEMVERIKRSKRYSEVLKVLFRKGRLPSSEIARVLDSTERMVYDTCYNMTRDNWNPNPVEKISGEWQLTLPGEILVNRLLEKYPDGQSVKSENSMTDR